MQLHLHLLSDSTGETLEHIGKAAIAQFENVETIRHFWPMVRSEQHLQRILEEVARNPGLWVQAPTLENFATVLTVSDRLNVYAYLGNSLDKAAAPGFGNANTTEIYGAATYKQFTVKYSHSLGRLFGTLGSKNSGYLDVSANFDLGNGWSVVPHIGRQRVSGNADAVYGVSPAYTDYSITVNKDMDGLVLSGAIVGSDAKAGFYTNTVANKNMGQTGLVLSIKKNF